ncbi:hypothetical protein GW17_00022823 [Ensete ventricosum]|nr:hypothetical protein GW17_00022823 [Ensete ventricosum]
MTFKLFKIMKDHKNPKVLSEGVLWMVSAVEDFGVSHIKLKVPYITAALAESKLGAEGRKDLFDWLTRHLSKANDLSDASPLLKPTATALTAAECCLGEVLRVCGQEAVCELCINYF